MLIRILSAVILLPLFLAVLLLLPTIYSAILFGLMAAVAGYELLSGTGLVKNARLVIYSAIMAFLVAFWSFLNDYYPWLQLAFVVYIVLLLIEVMIDLEKLSFEKVCVCLAAGLVIPFMISALVRLRSGAHGKIFVLIPFLLSFVSDSGAYFVGVFFGKHKLAPKISPKKTIEGLIGGIVSTVAGMIIFCLILNNHFRFDVNYVAAAIFGVAGSLICVFGDLSFSAIKRQTGIKDYGNLIPGHGGVLDRFDSTIFAAPVVEIFLSIWPVMVNAL